MKTSPQKLIYDKNYRKEHRKEHIAYSVKYQKDHPEGTREIRKRWKKNHPEETKAHKRKNANKYQKRNNLKKYGLSIDEYNQMLKKQNNICLICEKEFGSTVLSRPNVDHCHKTGIIRGIICGRCNIGIAHFEDNVETLKKAINYLEQSRVGRLE